MVLLASSLGLKVLSTDQDKARPDIDGYVEILNSSLKGYDEFTLCGRFLVYHFPRNPGQMDYQLILSVGKRYLLSSYGASPCEDLYPGCTDYFKARRYIQTLLSLVEHLHYYATRFYVTVLSLVETYITVLSLVEHLHNCDLW